MDSGGQPHIDNLFHALGKPPLVLPDEINLPTLKKLQDFVTEELKLNASIIKLLTVKQIVDELIESRKSQAILQSKVDLLVDQLQRNPQPLQPSSVTSFTRKSSACREYETSIHSVHQSTKTKL